MNNLNDWSKSESKKQVSAWGDRYPKWLIRMYEFMVPGKGSVLDLGCGFGRFPYWLKNDAPITFKRTYAGWDSSEGMLEEFHKKYSPTTFPTSLFDFTKPFKKYFDNVLCAAVFIHLTIEEQQGILLSLSHIQPKRIAFDINSPPEEWITENRADNLHSFEKHTGGFRYTWQSHYKMTEQVLELFPKYIISVSFYTMPKSGYHKAIYTLRKGQ